MPSRSVLIAGETWISYKVDVKGFSSYSTSTYGEGHAELLDAFAAAGHKVKSIANHLAVNEFPATAAELAPYDVVILSDISADTLQIHPDCFDLGQRTPDRLRVLADWVGTGGGLLMVGGYMSFSGLEGKARYQSTPLADVLPVEMLGFDDRVETPEGVTPVVEHAHAVVEGLPEDWPHFLGYNRVRAKAGADTVMSVGPDPFLVVGTHGDGRVAAFASDCSPHWGSPEFLAWAGYGPFWSALIDWTASSPRASAHETVRAVG